VHINGAPGTVTNAGTIGGGAYSVLFGGTGANVLTLQTGSVLNGTAAGSTAMGATNALILQGTGTANNNFTNFTTLDVQGAWSLSGTASFSNTATVESGSTLGGTGTISATNGVTINGGGAIHGGALGGIGTLNTNGNLTFNPGGILATTISPSGTASLVNVAGNATLTGGAVQVTASSLITHTETFTILTSTNPISGAFSSAAIVGTAFARNPRLSEDAAMQNVFLTVDSGSFAAVLPTSATSNQTNLAKAIDNGLIGLGSGNLPASFQTLGNLPVTNLQGALSQLSGETATGSQQTTFGAMTQFLGLLLDPFIDGRGAAATSGGGATPFAAEASAYAADGKARNANALFTKAPPPAPFEARWSSWAAGFGGSQTTDGNATVGSNTATSRIFGTAAGADYRFSPFTIAGFALAGGGTNFSVTNSGTGRSDLFQAGAFVKHTVGPAYISAALAYGWQDVTTDRTVTVAGIDRLHAEFNANAFSGRVEGGYRFVSPWIGGIGITPYAAGQFTTFDLPAYAESALAGSNDFALSYGSQSVTDSRSELGFRTDKSYAMPNGVLTLRSRFAWAHDFNPDRNIAATFQSLPGASFIVGGAAQAADSALTTASIEMKWLNGWSAAATFEGEFSNVTQSYAGKAVVRYNW
ncbi:MAG TPA: autotransporter domain-containing protein, partial [Bradyrhizobium sp.]|nr:autotransporter domain-containing protein [Bradyrhizobium sp.]